MMLYSFDDFTLDAMHYELRRAGKLVAIEPRVLDVIACLVQHAGRTVTTEELLTQLYPHEFAPHNRLTNAVAQARKALGDTGQTQRYIQTIRRRGYRFVISVTAQPPGVADLSAAPALHRPQPPVTPTLDQANAVSALAPGPTAAPSSRPQTPLSYTPVHLAEKILTSRSALEGERKQVTVLCATLHGGAELLANCNPEEAQRLLDPFLDRMMEAIHRYEGTVNHISGDGIMALFGAPLTHEDHAARACYAALAMQKTIGQCAEELRHATGMEIQLRAGLNSGEVVVRAIGNDLHMEYSAVGQTMYLATQLEQLVPPGAIWLAGETLRRVEGFVRIKPLDPVRIGGQTGHVEVFELIGAESTRTRLQAATRRVLTPFVGRQHELETLHQAQELASTGHGQVVAVIGEPGVGKSRLFLEFTHARHLKGWSILEAGAVSSYGKATPYLPIIDLLKAYFQVDGPDEQRDTHERVADKLLALDEALRSTLPAFCTLLDIPVEDTPWQALDPPQRRQRILDAAKRLLLRESQVQPLVVIMENLHWIDTETQAFLDSLVESLPTARILLLVNYRPEYQHSWGNKTYYTQLRLDSLSPVRAEELLQALLGQDASLQSLKQRLIERTEGNPFFLEESVRTLAETKALVGEGGAYRLAQALPSVQVPATVQAMLAARVDRLPPEDKRLLQAAAVIGRDVPLPLLHVIAEGSEEAVLRGLAHLQAAEFLYELQIFPEHVYTFKHALTQEVAYQSLLQRTRKHYHQQIAQMLSERFPDTVESRPELLAHHYAEAGLSAQAVPYWQRAGERAIERSAYREALTYLASGLEGVPMLPETPERLRQELALQLALGVALTATKGQADSEKKRAYLRAWELYQQVGEAAQFIPVHRGLWGTYTARAELQPARRWAEQLLIHAQQERDPALLLQAHRELGETLYSLGEFTLARTHLERGMALATLPQSVSVAFRSGFDPRLACRCDMAWTLWLLGYPDQAWRHEREALVMARQLEHPLSMAYAWYCTAVLCQLGRDLPAVQEAAEALETLSAAQGFPQYHALGMILRGWALAMQSQGVEGVAETYQGLTTFRGLGGRLRVPYLLALLAEGYGCAGAATMGLRAITEALTLSQHTGELWYKAELYRLKGEFQGHQGSGGGSLRGAPSTASRPADADAPGCVGVETWVHRALEVAHSQRARMLELRAAVSLSRLWQQQGKCVEARHLLAEIYGWFTEGFSAVDLREAKAMLEELS